VSLNYYPLIDVIEAEPITTPDGVTYEIDWDDEGQDYVPDEETLRWWER
jgi:hypothetical protein